MANELYDLVDYEPTGGFFSDHGFSWCPCAIPRDPDANKPGILVDYSYDGIGFDKLYHLVEGVDLDSIERGAFASWSPSGSWMDEATDQYSVLLDSEADLMQYIRERFEHTGAGCWCKAFAEYMKPDADGLVDDIGAFDYFEDLRTPSYSPILNVFLDENNLPPASDIGYFWELGSSSLLVNGMDGYQELFSDVPEPDVYDADWFVNVALEREGLDDLGGVSFERPCWFRCNPAFTLAATREMDIRKVIDVLNRIEIMQRRKMADAVGCPSRRLR